MYGNVWTCTIHWYRGTEQKIKKQKKPNLYLCPIRLPRNNARIIMIITTTTPIPPPKKNKKERKKLKSIPLETEVHNN